jgi:exosome complex component RRP46
MVNASSLALLNAGSITMKGVVTAIAVGLRKDGTFSVDPELAEEKGLSGIGCFAFLFAHGLRDDNEDCVLTQWQGRADESQIVEARKVAQVAAQDVLRRFKTSLGPQALLDEEENESMSDHDEEVDDDKMEI